VAGLAAVVAGAVAATPAAAAEPPSATAATAGAVPGHVAGLAAVVAAASTAAAATAVAAAAAGAVPGHVARLATLEAATAAAASSSVAAAAVAASAVAASAVGARAVPCHVAGLAALVARAGTAPAAGSPAAAPATTVAATAAARSATAAGAVAAAASSSASAAPDEGSVGAGHVDGLSAAVVTLRDGKLHLLALRERAEALRLDRRLVHEEIFAAVLGGDEPEALGVVEPLHRPPLSRRRRHRNPRTLALRMLGLDFFFPLPCPSLAARSYLLASCQRVLYIEEGGAYEEGAGGSDGRDGSGDVGGGSDAVWSAAAEAPAPRARWALVGSLTCGVGQHGRGGRGRGWQAAALLVGLVFCAL
jgi:hypothetical protein